MDVAKSRARQKLGTNGKGRADPVVSIIMPVYNRAERILRAIDSVLAQTFQDYELIVVDDGSTDDLAGSLSRFNDPRLRIISHDQNKGAAAARNTGISQARGIYIALLDSDDFWLPEKLERQVEFMRTHSGEFRLSCTGYKIISPYHSDGEIRIDQPIIKERHLWSGCRVSPGATLMAERSLFVEVGPLREEMPRLEDWDWLLRCSKLTNLAVLGEILSVVDYTDANQIDYRSVKKAASIMRRAHFPSSGFQLSGARRKFLATLENEMAAAAYRNRLYGTALLHLFQSLLYLPYRSLDYFRRLSVAVITDSLHSSQDHKAGSVPDLTGQDHPASIFHIITGLGPGGAETQLCLLVLALQSSGVSQYVISLKDRGVHAKRLEAAGVPVTALEVNSIFHAPFCILTIYRLVRLLKPNIIQGWMYHGNLAAALSHRFAPGRARRRLYWNIRASNMDARRYRNIVTWNARLSPWPDLIIANSNAGSAFHVAQGFRPKRIEIIPNGINTLRFKPNAKTRKSVRKELGIAEDAVVAINVARVDPMKDHATWLAAMAANPDVQGLLVGTDTETLDLPDNVMALGLRIDVEHFYQAADLVVSSSAFGEGFSNAIAEGMACGLIPVVTDVGDSAQIVGDTGCVVAPGDPQALAEAIRKEAASPRNKIRRHKVRARQRILDNFTVESMIGRFVDCYEVETV